MSLKIIYVHDDSVVRSDGLFSWRGERYLYRTNSNVGACINKWCKEFSAGKLSSEEFKIELREQNRMDDEIMLIGNSNGERAGSWGSRS